METTLKVSGVLADPTRFYIYQYIAKALRDVTVQEIANEFEIHPNVARLHLTKLEDVHLIVSSTEKNGKGGRPSRLYRISNELIQLSFPYRDYKLLSTIALEALTNLGEAGKEALFETGKKFGEKVILQDLTITGRALQNLSIDEKIAIFKNALGTAGLSPVFEKLPGDNKYFIDVCNCPFREAQAGCTENVCGMHIEFIKGMAETVFENVSLQNKGIMTNVDNTCKYELILS